MGISFTNFSATTATVNQDGFDLQMPATITNQTTTFVFENEQPAGRYTISSSDNNHNYDLYLVSKNNQNAGYSNTNSIVATSSFNKIVLYGNSPNVIYTFSYKLLGAIGTSGELDSGAGPVLISATPSSLPNVDSTTVVTGGNFASDVRIFFIDSNDVETEAKSVIRSNSQQLIVTRPDNMLIEDGPFTMKAVNNSLDEPTAGANLLTDYFDAGQLVQWVTATVPGYLTNTNYSEFLLATDPDGASVEYSIIAGALPSGLSLNSSTGEISGTTSDTGIAYVTVRATDAGGNYADRVFAFSRPATLNIIQTSGSVTVAENDTPFLISGGGGAGGNAFFTTGSWAGGGSGYITTGNINAGTHSLSIGAGGVGAEYNGTGGDGGTTTFSNFSAAGGKWGRSNNGEGGSQGGPGVGVISNQAGADGATGFINGGGTNGSGVTLQNPWLTYAQSSNDPLYMEAGTLTYQVSNGRSAGTGGKFYSGGAGTQSTSNYYLQAVSNTDGGNGIYGGGGGAGGGGASNNATGPGSQRSGDGGDGLLAIITYV